MNDLINELNFLRVSLGDLVKRLGRAMSLARGEGRRSRHYGNLRRLDFAELQYRREFHPCVRCDLRSHVRGFSGATDPVLGAPTGSCDDYCIHSLSMDDWMALVADVDVFVSERSGVVPEAVASGLEMVEPVKGEPETEVSEEAREAQPRRADAMIRCEPLDPEDADDVLMEVDSMRVVPPRSPGDGRFVRPADLFEFGMDVPEGPTPPGAMFKDVKPFGE